MRLKSLVYRSNCGFDANAKHVLAYFHELWICNEFVWGTVIVSGAFIYHLIILQCLIEYAGNIVVFKDYVIYICLIWLCCNCKQTMDDKEVNGIWHRSSSKLREKIEETVPLLSDTGETVTNN